MNPKAPSQDTNARDLLTERVIGLAIEVPLSIVYKTVKLDCGYRLDLVVDGRLIVELKTVERLIAVHEAQLLTYLKLSGIRTGFS